MQGLAVHPGLVAPLRLDRLSWEEVRGWLEKIGYGYLEEDPRAVLTAVQRRSRPRLIDGRLDGTTAILIANLASIAPETGPTTTP